MDAAGHYREFTSFAGLIGPLAADFTVYHYDRRGRGESTDTAPYAVEREVDDLAALVEVAGGSAFVYGFSSGALVAVHAAATNLAIPKLALLEPPVGTDQDRPAQSAFTDDLADLVAAGRRGGAVEHFLTGIGVPDEAIAEMRGTSSWSAMAAVAHTLVYDSLISEATSSQLPGSVTVPTLVLDSEGSSDDLSGMAAIHRPGGVPVRGVVAGQILPRGPLLVSRGDLPGQIGVPVTSGQLVHRHHDARASAVAWSSAGTLPRLRCSSHSWCAGRRTTVAQVRGTPSSLRSARIHR